MKISPDRLNIIFAFGKMRQSDNGIHRRSYVVANSRKKFRFRLCRLLGFFGSYFKLLVFFRKLFIQFCSALLFYRDIAPDINDRIACIYYKLAVICKLYPCKNIRGCKKSRKQTGIIARNDLLTVKKYQYKSDKGIQHNKTDSHGHKEDSSFVFDVFGKREEKARERV